MKNALISTVLAVAALLALAWAVAAQQGETPGAFAPFAIQVQHQEPITVVATTTTAAGDIITVTTPITLDIDLRIDVTGPTVAAITAPGATASSTNVELIIADPKPAAGADGYIDASGRIYTIDAPAALVIGQVQSKESFMGAEIIGQITNASDAALEYVQIVAQFYDADGTLLSVDTGYANLDTIEPGQTSPFQILSQAPIADVAGYALQASE